MGIRLSEPAWQMLQRLEQSSAALAFSEDEGRFYFVLHEEAVDLVRPSTMEALTRSGFIRRERTKTPWYQISDRGRAALRQKLDQECSANSEDPQKTSSVCGWV